LVRSFRHYMYFLKCLLNFFLLLLEFYFFLSVGKYTTVFIFDKQYLKKD
jgi:hypothetical protein